MAKLNWNTPGSRKFETGIDHGVLYLKGKPGVPWTGLVSMTKSSKDGSINPHYSESVKFLNLTNPGEFKGKLKALGYPDEFAACDGTVEIGGLSLYQQARIPFGMSYRTKSGDDVSGIDGGHKIHIIYNAVASASERTYSSISDDPDIMEYSWDLTTTPVAFDGYLPTSSLTLDLNAISSDVLKLIEDALYGTSTKSAYLPTPSQILTFIRQQALVEDLPVDPGTYLIYQDSMSENLSDLGTWTIVSDLIYEDPNDPGTYLRGIAA